MSCKHLRAVGVIGLGGAGRLLEGEDMLDGEDVLDGLRLAHVRPPTRMLSLVS
jgi:hypothetical protein